MEILTVAALIFVSLIFYVNIRVSLAIQRLKLLSNQEKVFFFLVVWLIPFLGVLLLPKKVLPDLHKSTDRTGFLSGENSSGSGGDCG